MPLDEQNQGLRDRSDYVNSSDPLVSFLYILIRDHLPCGTVEGIYQKHVAGTGDSEFCNGYLALYAKDLARRLQESRDE
jgi:hypothetical protein